MGTALIRTAVGKACVDGYKAVDVVVFANNLPMLSLVIRLGFKPVRIDYRRRFDGEDAVCLKKYGI